MTSKERVIAALNHQQPDKMPFDLGGCGQTGMNASTLYRLRQALGLDNHPIKVCEPYQILGEIEWDMINRLGVDVLPLWNRGSLMGISNTNITKPWQLADGTPLLMDQEFEYDVDSRGYTMVYCCGDRPEDYCVQMPPNGSFFDGIERAEEPDEDNLTPLEDFAESFTLKTEEDCKFWEKQLKEIENHSDMAVMGVLGGMGLGDAAEIPGTFLRNPKGIRTYAGWLEAHILYPEYIQQVFELQTEMALKNLELYRQAVGDKIQAVWLSGTDFGTQHSTMHPLKTFRELYKPFYKRVNDWVHKNTNWKTFYHTCGAIAEYIPDFIDMGADIINPVQCSARGMDAQMLKDRFGDQIVFWGGGVDTQHTLPHGTPEEVYKEVSERIRIFNKGGGYVFAPIHNVVAGVPVENLQAMLKAVEDFR